MMIQKYNNLRVLIIILISNCGINNFLNAQQPYGIPIYSNCYQRVEGGIRGGFQKFKFINTKAGRRVNLSITNPLDLDVFEVYVKEYSSEIFEFYTSGDGTLNVPIKYQSLLIKPIPSQSGPNYATTQIDFVDFDF